MANVPGLLGERKHAGRVVALVPGDGPNGVALGPVGVGRVGVDRGPDRQLGQAQQDRGHPDDCKCGLWGREPGRGCFTGVL